MKTQSLVTLQSTVVHREGKVVRPEIGKAFAYTDDEIKDIRAAEKAHGTVILRPAKNEDEAAAKAAAIAAKAEGTLRDLVADSKDADELAKGKAADSKEAKAAAKAKDEVRKHCEATGLAVPAGFEAADL